MSAYYISSAVIGAKKQEILTPVLEAQYKEVGYIY